MFMCFIEIFICWLQVGLNGLAITISIPCAVGDKVTVVSPAGNALAIDRGYSATGGTLSTTESTNVDANGIMNVAGAIGTWVYTATSTSVKITSVTGGMNIQKIMIGSAGGATCKEYTVTGGATKTFTVSDLMASTMYTYQVKAINGGYSAVQNIKTSDPLGMDNADALNSQASLFPNPSVNEFQIAGIEGIATVSVSNMSGKLLLTKDVSTNEAIDIQSLTQGMYMVKVASARGTFLRKLMKK